MFGRLTTDVVRMNARLHMGLPALVQDAETGEIFAREDTFLRKVHFDSPKNLRPTSKSLSDGLLVLMGDKQPALDEIRLALNHSRQIDEFEQAGQVSATHASPWLSEEIKSAQWRSLVSLLMCHNIDWQAQFAMHGIGAELLYQDVVWCEVQRRELCHLPVLNPEYLSRLPLELLTDVVKHTLMSVIGPARSIYRDQGLPPQAKSSFFRYGMERIDDHLDEMMIEVRRLHHIHQGRVPPERLKKLHQLIKKYFDNRNDKVAPNLAWHFKRFTTEIKAYYSKRPQ